MARSPQTTTSYSAILERHTPGGKEAGVPIQTLSDVSERRGARDAAAARLSGRQMPPEWAETGVVFEDQYVVVVRDAVRFSSGALGTYIRVLQKPLDRTGAVVVVEKDGRYLLVRHYRHATGRYHREFVRGWAEPDDLDGAATARREVCEELGVEADDVVAVRVLGFGYPDSGLLATRVCFAIATIAPDADLVVEETEGIVGGGADEPAIIALTRSEIRALVRDGLIDDNFTLAALQLLDASEADTR
jgi:ADP-ribose pyrophosphatase